MPEVPVLHGGRILLRGWRDEDLEPFARLNGDPEVMEHFPSTLTRRESDAVAASIRAHFERHGFGLWVLEVPGTAQFAGFVGLSVPAFEAPFTPCVEVGWRLAPDLWGRGYATEGAALALDFAFERLGLVEVVSFTVAANVRSRRVMERLGMHHAGEDDFDHPFLPPAIRCVATSSTASRRRSGFAPAGCDRWHP